MTRVETFHFLPGRLAWLGVVLAVLALAGGGCGSSSGNDTNAVLGQVMGQQTAALLGGKGSVVILISQPDNEPSTGLDDTIAAFKQGLGKSITVTVDNLKLQPLPGELLLTPQKFAAALQQHATADALVSFVVLPPLSAGAVQSLPSPRPKVVSMTGVPAKNLFAQGVVYLAVAPKATAPGASTSSGSVQSQFDAQYQLVTPATAGSLPQ